MISLAEVSDDLKEGLKSQELQKQLKTIYLAQLQKRRASRFSTKLKQLDALLPKAGKG